MPVFAGISLSTEVFVLVVLYLLFVGVVKGCTGFAIGLLSVPVLVQFFPPKIALAALTLPMFLANIPMFLSDGVPWRLLTDRPAFFVAILLGTVVGVMGFVAISAASIDLFLSAYLAAFLVTRHRSSNFHQRTRSRLPGVLVGTVGGVVAGGFLSGGPIFVSYLYGAHTKKAEFAVRLSLIFLVITGLRILTLYPLGLFGWPEVLLGLGFLVPLTAGILVGVRIRAYVPQRVFNGLIEVLLLIVALKLGYEGLTALA